MKLKLNFFPIKIIIKPDHHAGQKRTALHGAAFSFAAIAAAVSLAAASCLPVQAANELEQRLEEQRAMAIQSNEVENWPQGPVVSAESAILIESETGTVLYAKNIHQQEYPASTTKLLTCLLAAERSSMDEIVTMSNTAVFDTPRDSSHIALDVGNELTMEQCLNAILIRSANEVSFAVAEHISGTWQEFAELMNERAKELGCVDSNFVNPNGLPDENHYTSAHDLAMIGRAFFSNELLCKISSSTRLHLPPTDKQPKDIIENTTNKLLKGQTYEYEYLVGSKTGYTNAARSCLVSCAEKDGMRLICVVMRDEAPLQYEDTISLFNYGFSSFEKVNVSQTETKYNIDNAGFFYSGNDIFGSSKPILSLNKDDCIILPKTASFTDTVSTISYDTEDPGQAALITYTYSGVSIGTASVDFAADEEESYSFEEDAEISGLKNSGNSSEPSVIFINVARIFLWAAVIAALITVIILLRWFFKNHEFASRQSGRRSWKKERKRQQNRYQTMDLSFKELRRSQVRQAKKRRKSAKKSHKNRGL